MKWLNLLVVFFGCQTKVKAQGIMYEAQRPFILQFKKNLSCKGCRYYVSNGRKCRKFHKLVDNLYIDLEKAQTCRLDKTKCGPLGKYFVEE